MLYNTRIINTFDLRMLWYILSKCYKSARASFPKHFPRRENGLKEMKLASTTGEMFYITLFPFSTSNISHLCHENSFIALETHPPLAVFFLLRAYIGSKFTKNCVSFFPKHFYGGGFNFYLMNAQFYTREMFFTDFYFATLIVTQNGRVSNTMFLKIILF